MIYKYSSFLEDRILESLINESVLYFSPELRQLLTSLSSSTDIASKLLDIERTDITPDMTYLDIDTKEEGNVTFIQAENAKKLILAKFPTTTDFDTFTTDTINTIHKYDSSVGVFSKSRNSVKLGRFINRAIPGLKDKDVEDFVNKFKASINNKKERFEIVEGDQIPYWYESSKYAQFSGSLGNSCMAKKSSNIFEIYSKNPEVCRMLILREGDVIWGRALIWKVNPGNDFEYFLDRQYTAKDSDVIKFRNYADEQGWSFKTNNSHTSYSFVTYKGESKSINMSVQLKNTKYNAYPYVDTFRRLDKENILHNDKNEEGNEGDYLLDSTGGGYTEIIGGVWSEWHDCRIPEDEAVWSDYCDSYLRREDAVRISRGRRDWFPEDSDYVSWSNIYDDYILLDDSVWSDIYDTYILDTDSMLVVEEIDSDGEARSSSNSYRTDGDELAIKMNKVSDMLWYRAYSSRYPRRWSDYNGINLDILTKNYNDEYIPIIVKTTAYKSGDLWLDEFDAELLNLELNKDESRVIDYIEYYKNLNEIPASPEETTLDEIKGKLKGLRDKAIENNESVPQIIVDKMFSISYRDYF